MAGLEAETSAATSAAEVESIRIDMHNELKRATDLSLEVGRSAGETGPYRHLSDRTVIRPGRDFTPTQKPRIIEANRARNGGRIMSDEPLDPFQVLSDPQRAVSPGLGGGPKDMSMAEVDHIVPVDQGGTNSYGNARVVSARWNQLKRNR
jgi:hypothetical protein